LRYALINLVARPPRLINGGKWLAHVCSISFAEGSCNRGGRVFGYVGLTL
jgi:hypothetical protein